MTIHAKSFTPLNPKAIPVKEKKVLLIIATVAQPNIYSSTFKTDLSLSLSLTVLHFTVTHLSLLYYKGETSECAVTFSHRKTGPTYSVAENIHGGQLNNKNGYRPSVIGL